MSVKHDENPSPPWVKYPDKEPYWGGWRQGESEHWLLNVWLPFWQKLTETEQQTFFENYPPPNDEWRDHILKHWH